MNNYLLVINAGSSSIKFSIYQKAILSSLRLDATGQIDGIGSHAHFVVKDAQGQVLSDCPLSAEQANNHADAIIIIRSWLLEYIKGGILLAVGHRVVHGGQHYFTPILIDENILIDLENLIPLAPLHQPHNLAAMRALLEIMPTLPQVACFDTAFHRTQPDIAQHFALPRHITDAGVRRYGFHGLSYEYIVSILPDLDTSLVKARIIVAHLGNGASLCAIQSGRSIATTMGFSPLDGLIMGTRCGSLDPGVLLYLTNHYNMDAHALEQLLYYQSGLLGVSGISNDMHTLLDSDDPQAKEAVDLFVYRAGREIGSLVAALGGLDALIFTGGMGENSAKIRAKICHQAEWLGLKLDASANEAGALCISMSSSNLSAWVVNTDENMMIALHTLQQISDDFDILPHLKEGDS